MSDYSQVVTTTDSKASAERLAEGIVAARLGACVQVVGPIRSVYRWQGQVHADEEWQCVTKTTTALVDALTAHIKEHHTYDVPEVVATPIIGGNPDYLAWIGEETR